MGEGKRHKQAGQSQGYTLTINTALLRYGDKVTITSIIHHRCAAQTVCWIARQGQQRFKSSERAKTTSQNFPRRDRFALRAHPTGALKNGRPAQHTVLLVEPGVQIKSSERAKKTSQNFPRRDRFALRAHPTGALKNGRPAQHTVLLVEPGVQIKSSERAKKNPPRGGFIYLVRPEGFEPPTNWFEASYSIQLSYERGKYGVVET